VIFLHNMLRLVVGHPLQPTTLTISTHMNHIHIALILIIVLVVHRGDNSTIFLMSKSTPISATRDLIQIPIFTTRTGATILISRGKLKPWEIVLPNLKNCTILIIHSSITNLPILHPKIIQPLLHSPLWKALSRSSWSSQTRLLVT
jgi:hypothetical protein